MKNNLVLVMALSVISIGMALAQTITLDDTQSVCLGTDCEFMEGASGTITLEDCMNNLHMNVDLSGLEAGNYQLSLQTYGGDDRLDSTEICDNPNGPMAGHENAWECGSWEDYSFYNFEMDGLTTDGNFQKSYDITLPEGYYDVILLVKHDKTPEGTGGASYPIILQKEHITFSVSEYCVSQCMERITALEQRVADLEAIEPIPGPQGEKGDKGDTGEQGPKGDTGTCTCDLSEVNEELDDLLEIIDASKEYPGFDDFWAWYLSPQECTNGQLRCVADESQKCVNYAWTSQGNCEYGCNNGVCNAPPVTTENCLAKPSSWCCNSGGYKIEKHYPFCKQGQGTATECNLGQCFEKKSTHVWYGSQVKCVAKTGLPKC